MRYKRKKKTKQKNLWSILSCRKEWDVHREEKMRKSKYTYIKNTQNYKILEFKEFCSG